MPTWVVSSGPSREWKGFSIVGCTPFKFEIPPPVFWVLRGAWGFFGLPSTQDVLELLPSLDATLIDTGRRTAKASQRNTKKPRDEVKRTKGFGDSLSLVDNQTSNGKIWMFLSLEVLILRMFSTDGAQYFDFFETNFLMASVFHATKRTKSPIKRTFFRIHRYTFWKHSPLFERGWWDTPNLKLATNFMVDSVFNPASYIEVSGRFQVAIEMVGAWSAPESNASDLGEKGDLLER